MRPFVPLAERPPRRRGRPTDARRRAFGEVHLALFRLLVAGLLVALPGLSRPARAQGAEKRIALVIGNAAYPGGALAAAANDAGLVAQTLQAAGFDVAGARDLDEASLRRTLHEFLDKAAAAGPEAVAFVYLAGYGLQLEGENYFAPVDARIAAPSDIPVAGLRVSDYAKRLAALPLKARFVVLDAGRRNPFGGRDAPLAGGLALTEAEPGSLVAFNAAPGMVGPEEAGPYGAYARALAEMIRAGGLPPAALFDHVRLRTAETTKGALVPWDSARIAAPFLFLERGPDAPALPRPEAALRGRPLPEIGARDAFALCLERDAVEDYLGFLAAYPNDPQAGRVRALLAARREAITWRETRAAGTPPAYWSYLRRYPRGPHAPEARRRLMSLAAMPAPPPRFGEIAYTLPPPPAEEIVYVEQPVLVLADPVYALPPPAAFLAPPPAVLVDLAPPPPPPAAHLLPVPAYAAVPAYVALPARVAPPPDNPLFGRLHHDLAAPLAGAATGAAIGAAAARVALPPSLGGRGGPPAAQPGRLLPHALPQPSRPAPPLAPGPRSALPPAPPAQMPLAQPPAAPPRALSPRPDQTARQAAKARAGAEAQGRAQMIRQMQAARLEQMQAMRVQQLQRSAQEHRMPVMPRPAIPNPAAPYRPQALPPQAAVPRPAAPPRQAAPSRQSPPVRSCPPGKPCH